MLAPPIFPGRRQPGIVGRNELNYRVRNGNGWTLALIGTNFVGAKSASFRFRQPASGCPAKTALRSFAPPLQLELAPLDFELVLEERWSSLLYVIRQSRKTNWIINFSSSLVKGFLQTSARLSAHRSSAGAPSRTRTGDPLIKSQLLYQLS